MIARVLIYLLAIVGGLAITIAMWWGIASVFDPAALVPADDPETTVTLIDSDQEHSGTGPGNVEESTDESLDGSEEGIR